MAHQVALNQIVLFTTIAIIIAALGLLGRITSKAVEKTKEIGIRKVLGAGFHQIIIVLLETSGKQVLIATGIGIPLAWYLTDQYFQNFSGRIELKWWHFTLPLVALVIILLSTVLFRLLRAIRANPVES
jgi:putative ABC transport system permease protein